MAAFVRNKLMMIRREIMQGCAFSGL